MKLTKIVFVFLLLFTALGASANYGCNVGNYIYPNPTGGKNASGDPLYYSTNPITIRWWDQDPNCGIRDNKIYPRTNGDDNCEVNGKNWGVVYYYNPSDNSCVPLPLDDYVWVMILGIGALGFWLIRKKINFSYHS